MVNVETLKDICEVAFEADDKQCFQCLDSLVECRFNHTLARRFLERNGFRYRENPELPL